MQWLAWRQSLKTGFISTGSRMYQMLSVVNLNKYIFIMGELIHNILLLWSFVLHEAHYKYMTGDSPVVSI